MINDFLLVHAENCATTDLQVCENVGKSVEELQEQGEGRCGKGINIISREWLDISDLRRIDLKVCEPLNCFNLTAERQNRLKY
jgi:hypothetical protein